MLDIEFLVLRLRYIGFKVFNPGPEYDEDECEYITQIKPGLEPNTILFFTASDLWILRVHEDGADYVFRFLDDEDNFFIVPKVDILGEPN